MTCQLPDPSNAQKSHIILAYYDFVPIANPRAEVEAHKQFLATRDIKCRVYISEQGINGQMSATREAAKEYMEWMHANPIFANTIFKLNEHHEHAFPKTTVKYRPELVTLKAKVDLSQRGDYLDPIAWKELRQNVADHILLDVRNSYESKVGHFNGADLPPCDTFKEFSTYADQLKERVSKKETPVLMYCTGGIRCEVFSAVLKERGFENVYQLHGGIINYGNVVGADEWKGKLFVFDDRLTVPIAEGTQTEVIGRCTHCNTASESYYNCANMDCNELFLCCPDCLVKTVGCCCNDCKEAPRVRPYQQGIHKPFRKLQKGCACSSKKKANVSEKQRHQQVAEVM